MASKLNIQAPLATPSFTCMNARLHSATAEPLSANGNSNLKRRAITQREALTLTTTAAADFERLRQSLRTDVPGVISSSLSAWSRGITTIGAGISVATGLTATYRALQQDRIEHDHTYKRTLQAMLTNLAVTSSSFAVGSIVAGTAAALVSGTILVPAALGAAAGAGTAYAMGYALQRINPASDNAVSNSVVPNSVVSNAEVLEATVP